MLFHWLLRSSKASLVDYRGVVKSSSSENAFRLACWSSLRRDALSSPVRVNPKSAYLTNGIRVQPAVCHGEAAALDCINLVSFCVADASESNASDEVIANAHRDRGDPECQVRALRNMPLPGWHSGPPVVPVSSDMRTLAHCRHLRGIVWPIGIRDARIQALEFARVLRTIRAD